MGVPLILNLTLIAALGLLLVQSDREHRQEMRYRNITAASGDLFRLTYETPLTLYVALQSQAPAMFKWHDRDVEQLRKRGFEAIDDWRNDPLLYIKIADAKEQLTNLLFALDSLSQARKAGGLFELFTNLKSIQDRMHAVKDGALVTFSDVEQIGLARTQESQRQQESMRVAQVCILAAGAVLNYMVGFFMIAFYHKGIRKRLSIIQSNTELLSSGSELNTPLSGSDEIAQLDQAFHHMAAELKQASEREKALFNNASDVICVLDEQNRFLKINPASLKLWGFSADDLIGHSLLAGVPPQDRQQVLGAIQSAREIDGSVSFETKIMTRSGTLLDTLWSVYWSDSACNLYCVVHDITERKNAQRVKKQFLSMITSDLKIPLASIAAAINTLVTNLASTISQKAQDKLGTARKNVQRLLGLVNDLLQLTEFDATTLELHKQKCAISELFERAVQDVEGVAAKQQVAIELQNGATDWMVDPDRIMQVMVNLLSNAIKFSPVSSKVVLTSTIVGDMVEVKIIDRGRGVPASHREAIFEKFKQVDASDGKRKAGTGLGLPICKQIIEEHGGSIGVESEEGQGSTFWFKVPLKERTSLPPPKTRSRAKGRETQRIKAARQSRKREPVTNPKKAPGRQLKLIHKGIFLVGTPIIFGTILVGAVALLLFQASGERARELHERKIATNTNTLLQEYLRLGSAVVGPKTPQCWEQFQDAVRKSRAARSNLAELVKGDSSAEETFQKLGRNFQDQERWYQRAEAIMTDGEFSKRRLDAALADSDKLVPSMLVMVHRLHGLLMIAQVKEFVHPEVQSKLRTQQAMVLGVGLGANIGLSVLLAIFFSSDVTRRLRILADNAERLAKEEELRPELTGSDEIAQLDQTFHTTARKLIESRHKERAVFDNSQDVIFALDASGHFLSANPATLTMWQYQPKELIGTGVLDLVFGEDRDRTEAQMIGSSTSARNFESRVLRKDGTEMWAMWSVSKSAEDGCIYCIANDVTKRKELEQLKQDFLAVVSHDLRTPLTSITGVAKLISAGAFGEVGDAPQQVLAAITRNTDKLLELINDILDIEKLEAGQMNLLLENVRLRELLEKSVNSACGADPRKRVSILSAPNLEIRADKDRLVQAISNIVSHAVCFSPEDSPITIEVLNNNDCLEIKVRDAGPSLTDNACAQMFDRFKEVTERDANAGTGLALPIARKIVESHGGSVRVHPAATGGNEFFIRLPLQPTLTAAQS